LARPGAPSPGVENQREFNWAIDGSGQATLEKEIALAGAQGRTSPMSNIKHPLTPQVPSITGRDGYIELQALAYAITAIELRPDMYQEWSNKEDMKVLLDHFCSDKRFKQHLLDGARRHLTGIGWDATIEHDGNVVDFPAQS
jgi:hypothetical protein